MCCPRLAGKIFLNEAGAVGLSDDLAALANEWSSRLVPVVDHCDFVADGRPELSWCAFVARFRGALCCRLSHGCEADEEEQAEADGHLGHVHGLWTHLAGKRADLRKPASPFVSWFRNLHDCSITYCCRVACCWCCLWQFSFRIPLLQE